MVDHSEIQFGTLAVRRGFITSGQLGKAVSLQLKADLEQGVHRLLGAILVELGYMSPSQVEEVLKLQSAWGLP